MVLKRKRSSSTLLSPASSTSSSSTSSSPPQDRAAMMSMVTSPLLHSRTMKRFRNSRPSEDVVHQRTLNMLYSAQRNPIAAQEEPSPESYAAPARTNSTAQQSLHRFWNINSAPSTTIAGFHESSSQQMMQNSSSSCCEDCGASLATNGGADSMDIDEGSAEDAVACGACGKQVCFSCSVSNLGEQKRCLQCAGTRSAEGLSLHWKNSAFSLW